MSGRRLRLTKPTRYPSGSLVGGGSAFCWNVEAVLAIVVIVKAGGAEPQHVDTAKDPRRFPIADRTKPFGFLIGFLLLDRGGLELRFELAAVQVKSGCDHQRAQRKQRGTGGQYQLPIALAQAGQQRNNPQYGNTSP